MHVYPDAQYDKVLDQMEGFAPYALTGSIIAQDRRAIADATKRLRFAAGNFYVNDKPTGAVVGQQPFGGGRASGTNDKAGAAQNLLRWTSVRSIKETFVPADRPPTRTWADAPPRDRINRAPARAARRSRCRFFFFFLTAQCIGHPGWRAWPTSLEGFFGRR